MLLKTKSAVSVMLFVLLAQFLFPFLPSLYAATPTDGISLSTSSATFGYSSPVNITATASGGLSFDSGTAVSLWQNDVNQNANITGTFVSSSTMNINIGTGLAAGDYQIKFLKSNNTAYYANFSVVSPAITLGTASIPDTYSSGVSITVTGTNTNFSAGQTTVAVLDNTNENTNKAGAPTINGGTSLSFTLATGLSAGTYTVRVSTTGKETVDAVLTVAHPVAAIGPSSASFGYSSPVNVTLTGTGTSFNSGSTSVSILNSGTQTVAAVPSNVSVIHSTSLSFSIPTGLAAGTYIVKATTGQEVVSANFTVNTATMAISENGQTITSVTFGYTSNKTLNVIGTNTGFSSSTTLTLTDKNTNQDKSSFISGVTANSSTNLQFLLATGLDAGSYRLTAATSGVVATADFTVDARTISTDIGSSFSKDYVSSKTVNITGSSNANFNDTTIVKVIDSTTGADSGKAISPIASSPTQLSFTLNTGLAAGTYKVSVTTDGIETRSPAFTVTAASATLNPPTISNDISSTTSIAVTGTNSNFVNGTTAAQLLDASNNGVIPNVTVGTPVVSSATALTVTLQSDSTLATSTSYKLRFTTSNSSINEVIDVPLAVSKLTLSAYSLKEGYTSSNRIITVTGNGTAFDSNSVVSVVYGSNDSAVSGVTFTANNPALATVTLPLGLTANSGTPKTERIYTLKIGSDSVTFKVIPITSTGVTTVSNAVYVGDQVTLTPTITYGDGSTGAGGGLLTWSSSDTNVVTVNTSGVVTAVGNGSATVTAATDYNVSGTIALTVSTRGITLGTNSLKEGYTNASIAVTGTGTNFSQSGSVISVVYDTNKTVNGISYQVADGSALTITLPTGLLGGAGVAKTYTVTADTYTATFTVVPITSISVTGSTNVVIHSTTPLSVNATYSDGSTATGANLAQWSSSNNSIATVNASGVVTGVAAGTATITAVTYGGVSSTHSITVTPRGITLGTTSFKEGYSSATNTVTGTGTNFTSGSVVSVVDDTNKTVSGVTYQRINGTTLTITLPTGLLGGAGVAKTYTVTADTYTAVFSVIPITSVSITGSVNSVVQGSTLPLSFTATYSDMSTATGANLVTWSSSNTAVAAVSASGVVTGVAAGTVTITAVTKGGVSGNFVISVTAPQTPVQAAIDAITALPAANALALSDKAAVQNTRTLVTAANNNSAIGPGNLSKLEAAELKIGQLQVAAAKAALTESVIKNANTDLNNVTSDLTLPLSDASLSSNEGVAISWASDNTARITAAGTVTRAVYGQGDTTVTLTATFTVTTQSGTDTVVVTDTAVFTVVVKQLPQEVTVPVKRPGGGGGGGFPPAQTGESQNTSKSDGHVALEAKATVTKDDNGREVATVSVDAGKLGEAINSLNKNQAEQRVELNVAGSAEAAKVEVPASAIADAAKSAPDAVLAIKSEVAGYNLPVKLLDVAALANNLGVEAKDVKINISIDKVAGAALEKINDNAKEKGFKLLADAVEFKISAEANGKKIDVNSFDGTYVSRTFIIAKEINTAKTTGVLYNPETGKYSFVPATFKTVNGITEVSVKRPGNSIYTVVEADYAFADLNGHWSKSDVELLASKLVVEGKSANTFDPDSNITRAEFAGLLVRALGLTNDSAGVTAKFTDVNANDWFASEVSTAVKAGLVDGFENGTFRPQDHITREQVAVLISRAVKFAGKKADAPNTQLLAKFSDKNDISGWAQEAVAQVLEAGIVQGMTDTTFAAKSNATRAQAAALLKRMLVNIEFIN